MKTTVTRTTNMATDKPAKLSEKQTEMLLALYCWETWTVREGPLGWRATNRAKRDGRVAQGRSRTVQSLVRHGLAVFDHAAGRGP